MLKMLWTGEYDQEWEEKFKQLVQVKRAGFNVHNQFRQWMSEDEVIEALKDVDIFFVGYDPVTERVLKNSPDLKLILSERDGPEENVDLKACEEYGVPVLNSAGRCTVSVAELTFNLILNMSRPVIEVSNQIRQEKWSKGNYQQLRNIVEANSFEVYRKTLGIVGLGRNGRYLSKLALAFGMRVIGYDPFVDVEEMSGMGVEVKSLEEVMEQSDYISVLARVTPENHKLIGKKEISRMKSTSVLVNTGRPQLVDYDALIRALEKDTIRMAAVDVFQPEPIEEDSPFYDVPANKLILTNHMAGFCRERTWHQYDKGMDNLNCFLKGTCIKNNCTPKVTESERYDVRGGRLFASQK